MGAGAGGGMALSPHGDQQLSSPEHPAGLDPAMTDVRRC